MPELVIVSAKPVLPAAVLRVIGRRVGSTGLVSAGRNRAAAQNRYTILLTDPFDTVSIATDAPQPDPFKALKQVLSRYGFAHQHKSLPFCGGVAGYMAYEIGRFCEVVPKPAPNDMGLPDMYAGVYSDALVFDHFKNTMQIVATGFDKHHNSFDKKRANRQVYKWQKIIEQARHLPKLPARKHTPNPHAWEEETGQNSHMQKVGVTKNYIAAGDIYQANITRRFLAEKPKNTDDTELFCKLMEINPAPFAAFIRVAKDKSVLSASPERFLCVDSCGKVQTRPIKGTVPRLANPKADAAQVQKLLASEKDKAENLMITDLMRNDISRVCVAGSVKVPTLFGLETYETVHHLVSVVEGQLALKMDAIDLLKATFPPGSVTGAPKIRAQEIIAQLEEARRGIYCGTIFHFGFNGALDSSVVIRTLVTSGKSLCVQAGGGIVADSDAYGEYMESWDKARAMLAVI